MHPLCAACGAPGSQGQPGSRRPARALSHSPLSRTHCLPAPLPTCSALRPPQSSDRRVLAAAAEVVKKGLARVTLLGKPAEVQVRGGEFLCDAAAAAGGRAGGRWACCAGGQCGMPAWPPSRSCITPPPTQHARPISCAIGGRRQVQRRHLGLRGARLPGRWPHARVCAVGRFRRLRWLVRCCMPAHRLPAHPPPPHPPLRTPSPLRPTGPSVARCVALRGPAGGGAQGEAAEPGGGAGPAAGPQHVWCACWAWAWAEGGVCDGARAEGAWVVRGCLGGARWCAPGAWVD